jgi:hypothetical protein
MGLMVGALIHLPWAWSRTDRLLSGGSKPRAAWLWLHFQPTAASFLLLIVILTAVIGSATTMALTLGHRAGYRKLEEGWELWYLLRPVTAVGVGVLAYALLKAGLFTFTNPQSDLFAAAAVGGLAGLFTDQLLQKMRKILGLSDFEQEAQKPSQATPHQDKGADESQDGSTT